MSPSFDAVFFDLDGTLVDTEATAARVVEECFSGWGITLDASDAAHVTGRTWALALEFFFTKYAPPVPPAEAGALIMARYREALKTALAEIPGAARAVRALAARHPLALISGSMRAEIHFALDQLGIRDCFKVILGAEDYPLSKPAPDGYLKALDLLQLRPEKVLVFEDSTAGITSARAAGLWVAAVTAANHFDQDISGAHLSLPDLTGVDEAWLQGLFKRFHP